MINTFINRYFHFGIVFFYVSIINAEDYNKIEEKNIISCYFVSEYSPERQKNIFELNESSQRIEFTDEIGSNHGSGTLIEGSIIEKGKTILIKIQTSSSIKNDGINTTNTSTQIHYIDSNLLPRKIAVEGILLKGYVIIEKNNKIKLKSKK